MNTILELIPQRAPIVMVDRFLGLDDTGVSTTEFTVQADNLFVDEGLFSECGIIEHIAQSAAARVGFLFRQRAEAVPLGYIGSVNDLCIERLPRIGDTLHTTIRVVQEVSPITLIEAVCRIGEYPVATCRLKIFLES